jgi:Flp pilus assembly protein TadD
LPEDRNAWVLLASILDGRGRRGEAETARARARELHRPQPQ